MMISHGDAGSTHLGNVVSSRGQHARPSRVRMRNHGRSSGCTNRVNARSQAHLLFFYVTRRLTPMPLSLSPCFNTNCTRARELNSGAPWSEAGAICDFLGVMSFRSACAVRLFVWSERRWTLKKAHAH